MPENLLYQTDVPHFIPDSKKLKADSIIPQFPFAAIVGQEKLKDAILLNCINPSIGGVLISGEKGTAKSTVIRSLEALLPPIKVINLPLNATEDMVIGSLDIENALRHGKVTFQPGLLSKANNNILYIDEINLLSESLINTILDASASGKCTVEREGISHVFPSDFILIGSMNPEEGSLRPQILDRFGFFIEVQGETDWRDRMTIIKNRLAFEHNPSDFIDALDEKTKNWQHRISKAKKILKSIRLKDDIIQIIAEICQKSFIAGHRGDLALCQGVIAHAALCQQKYITLKNIEAVKDLALAHRIRSVSVPEEQNADAPDKDESESLNEQGENSHNNLRNIPEGDTNDSRQNDPSEPESSPEEELFDITPMDIDTCIIDNPQKDKNYRSSGSGRRSNTRTYSKHGHYVKVKLPGNKIKDPAFDATLRAAAPFQRIRKKNGLAINILHQDIREKIREKRIGNTILFLLDASGSMGIRQRMSEAKAAIFELLKESYKKRDTVGMMKFNHHQAELVLQPTRSLELAHKCLKNIKTGGKTPLAEGLERSVELMKGLMRKNPEILPVIILLSDGKANHSSKNISPTDAAIQAAKKAACENIRFIVIDTETGFIRLGMAEKLAKTINAEYYTLDDLKNIKEIVNKW